jgi:hypothetical protein
MTRSCLGSTRGQRCSRYPSIHIEKERETTGYLPGKSQEILGGKTTSLSIITGILNFTREVLQIGEEQEQGLLLPHPLIFHLYTHSSLMYLSITCPSLAGVGVIGVTTLPILNLLTNVVMLGYLPIQHMLSLEMELLVSSEV